MGGKGVIILALAVAIAMAMVDSSNWAVAYQPPDCTPQLTEMQSCLLFVEGKTTIPGSACCKSLSSVFYNSPVCLCEIISSSSGGVASTPGINITNAILLPSICKVPTDPSRCPALLSGSPAAAPPTKSPARPAKGSPSSASAASSLFPSLVVFFVSFLASELVLKIHD